MICRPCFLRLDLAYNFAEGIRKLEVDQFSKAKLQNLEMKPAENDNKPKAAVKQPILKPAWISPKSVECLEMQEQQIISIDIETSDESDQKESSEDLINSSEEGVLVIDESFLIDAPENESVNVGASSTQVQCNEDPMFSMMTISEKLAWYKTATVEEEKVEIKPKRNSRRRTSPVSCEVEGCNRSYFYDYKLDLHVRNVHDVNGVKTKTTPKPKPSQECPLCHKAVSGMSMTNHIESIHGKNIRLQCSRCPKTFLHMTQLKVHKLRCSIK